MSMYSSIIKFITLMFKNLINAKINPSVIPIAIPPIVRPSVTP